MINWSEHFTYCPTSGELRWKERERHLFKTYSAWRCTNSMIAGKLVVSTDKNGYLVARLMKKHFYAHRIIWEMNHGPIPPKMQIDHIDGCPSNNALSNLRLATPQQNKWNRKPPQNKLGGVGVWKHPKSKRYQAIITLNRRKKVIGSYRTKEEAAEAYKKASLRIHKEFSLFRRSKS
jgi:hypothetical protein